MPSVEDFTIISFSFIWIGKLEKQEPKYKLFDFCINITHKNHNSFFISDFYLTYFYYTLSYNACLVRWLRGRKYSPAKGACAQKRIEGSNPSLNAIAHPWLSWIEYTATNRLVGGSNPSGCAISNLLSLYLSFSSRHLSIIKFNSLCYYCKKFRAVNNCLF